MYSDESDILTRIFSKFFRLPYYRRVLFTLIAVAISIFFITFTSDDQVAGKFSDDAMYLLQAELYSPWQKNESPVIDLIRKESRFPPLYPIILGLLGADSYHIVLAAQISCGILLLSIFIFGVWIWSESKQVLATGLITILFSLLPCTLIMSQGLWSEFLFMFLIYAAFLCSDSKIDANQKWFFTALLIALSTLTRSIGISIAAAFILLIFIKRTKNKLILIATVISPFLLWTILRNIAQDYPSYFDDLSGLLSDISLSQVYDILLTRLSILADSWIWLFSIFDTYYINHDLIKLITLILFIFTLSGFLIRLKKLKLDALSIPLYMIIVMIWPYQNVFFVSRFLYPLLPAFLFYMWIGIQFLSRNKRIHNIILTFWTLSLILIAYPSSGQFIERGYKQVSDELKPYRRDRHWLLASDNKSAQLTLSFNKRLIDTLQELTHYIAKNECIYAYQAPIIILYTHRITSIFPPYTDSSEEFEQQTKACNLFLSMNITDLNNLYPPFYPIQHLMDDKKYEIKTFYDEESNDEKSNIFLIRRLQ